MKFLIIGLGSIGQRHTRNLHNLGYKDIIALRTGKSTKPFDLEIECFKDSDEAYRRKPDAVLVCNPTSLHIPTALEAANRGCHILIEKPLSDSLDKAKELQAIVREKKLTTLVAYNFRFHPAVARIKELIVGDFLGGVYFVRSQFASYLPAWHPWEDYKKSYASRADLGGGVVLTSSHELDMLRWLFGKYEKVSSTISSGKYLGIGAEELALIHIQFAGGVLAEVNLNYIQEPPKRYIEIVGEKGILFYDFYKDGIKFYSKEQKKWSTLFEPPEAAAEDTFSRELLHFIDCVKKGKETICSIDEGIETVRMALDAKNN